jgi:hypothetical protein
MPALLVNILINDLEKFELFKKTSSDIFKLFDEIHIKFRGKFTTSCLEYVDNNLECTPRHYQGLGDYDWVDSTLHMVKNIKSRSIFLYFEDHILLKTSSDLRVILDAFDTQKLDYLSYSFFQASQLEINNILPLNPVHHNSFSSFLLNKDSAIVLGEISKNYYSFSLVSICSVEYFSNLLKIENKKYKVYNKYLSIIFSKLFKYPLYRKVLSRMNIFLSYFSIRIVFYPINSPFNLEKMLIDNSYREGPAIGILKDELFANFDDDNGSYKESLIKRGLYPFNSLPRDEVIENLNDSTPLSSFVKILKKNEEFAFSFYPREARIIKLPIVKIYCLSGYITVVGNNESYAISTGQEKIFYSNLNLIIVSNQKSEIKFIIYKDG